MEEKAREHNEKMLEIEQDYWSRLFDMQSGSQSAMFKFTDSLRNSDYKSALKYGSLALSNAAKQNNALFGLQKALSLANVAVTLPSAVIKSFENGGGFPFGLIPAGLMAAQGAAQIAAISGSSLGGGASAPSVGGGGGGTSPSAPVASGLPAGSTAVLGGEEVRRTQVDITLEGRSYSREEVQELIGAINEEVGSGVELKAS